MHPTILKSTFEKALFLSETTRSEHVISINEIGTFHIERNSVRLQTEKGAWREITKDTLVDKKLHDLVA